MDKVAMKPTFTMFHARSNATFIAGTRQGKHVLAKMALPDINGTMEEEFKIVQEADTNAEIMAALRDIVSSKRQLVAV